MSKRFFRSSIFAFESILLQATALYFFSFVFFRYSVNIRVHVNVGYESFLKYIFVVHFQERKLQKLAVFGEKCVSDSKLGVASNTN